MIVDSGNKDRIVAIRGHCTKPTDFIEGGRVTCPIQTAFCRNGVHELVLGPKLWVGDLGLAQIPTETDFYVVDLEKVNRQNR